MVTLNPFHTVSCKNNDDVIISTIIYASELYANLNEMYPRYYMHSNISQHHISEYTL